MRSERCAFPVADWRSKPSGRRKTFESQVALVPALSE
jgi:hypothetical protein